MLFYYDAFLSEAALLFRSLTKKKEKESSSPIGDREGESRATGAGEGDIIPKAKSPNKKETKVWLSSVDKDSYLSGLRSQYRSMPVTCPPLGLVEEILTTGAGDSTISWRTFCLQLISKLPEAL
jgi:hypothetical protein